MFANKEKIFTGVLTMALSQNDIRNIALIGHSGEGKTSLAEAILYNAGALDRLGKVDDGNSTMDFDQEEISRKISISLSVANCNYKGKKINIIDVPGYFDFECEMLEALAVADSAVIVTGATGSLTVGTEKALEYCGEHKIPCMIFVNGIDKENQNFFTEYIHKLSKVYDKMTTAKGKEIALEMKSEAERFYNELYGYLDKLYSGGNSILDEYITE